MNAPCAFSRLGTLRTNPVPYRTLWISVSAYPSRALLRFQLYVQTPGQTTSRTSRFGLQRVGELRRVDGQKPSSWVVRFEYLNARQIPSLDLLFTISLRCDRPTHPGAFKLQPLFCLLVRRAVHCRSRCVIRPHRWIQGCK